MTLLKTLALPAILAMALAAGQAQAKTVAITLTGTVADAQTYSYVSNGMEYQQIAMGLDYNTSRPASVAVGDVLNVTVNFDQSLTIPASADFFELILQSYAYPANTGTGTSNITTSFFSGATQVGSTLIGGATTDTSELAAGTILSPPHSPFTFDRMVTSLKIATLGTSKAAKSFEIDEGLLFYEVVTPLTSPIAGVPEPASWALMLVGFGGVGALLRRRRLSAGQLQA